jgi:hypothetical protein
VIIAEQSEGDDHITDNASLEDIQEYRGEAGTQADRPLF